MTEKRGRWANTREVAKRIGDVWFWSFLLAATIHLIDFLNCQFASARRCPEWFDWIILFAAGFFGRYIASGEKSLKLFRSIDTASVKDENLP